MLIGSLLMRLIKVTHTLRFLHFVADVLSLLLHCMSSHPTWHCSSSRRVVECGFGDFWMSFGLYFLSEIRPDHSLLEDTHANFPLKDLRMAVMVVPNLLFGHN